MREGFGENVSQHVLGRNVVEFDFSAFDAFSNEVVTNIDVFGARMRYWVVS